MRPSGPIERDVGPRDRQDRRRAVRRAGDRARAGGRPGLGDRAGGSGRNGARCSRTATGPTPGPPPPWGMQKVLCRLRWLTSPPNQPGPGDADERVEVGAVDVHLAAVLVHEVADVGDALLEHAVGGRVGDHRARPGRRRAPRPWPRGRRRRRCRRRRRPPRRPRMPAITADAALVPWAEDGMRHTSRAGSPRDCVVAADGEEPGQLALRAGVGLERHAVVAGDLGQPAPRAR